MEKLHPSAGFLLETLDLPRPLRVMDVGANPLEDPPYGPLLRAGGCHLTGFEPQPDAFSRLQAEKGDCETYFQTALGTGEEGALHVTKAEGFTSLLMPDEKNIELVGWRRPTRVIERIPLKTARMDDLPGIVPQDVLKIDVQGAERDVIAHGRKTLENAVGMVIEVRFGRLYENEPMFGDIDVFLRALGFRFMKFLFIQSRQIVSSQSARVGKKWSRSQMTGGDAVYVRDFATPEAINDDQLKFLCLSAGSILQCRDVAVHCLDLLVERGAIDRAAPAHYMDLAIQSVETR